MWLSCETHETIAEAVNMVRQTVSDKIRKIAENCKISQTGIFADFTQEGSPLLVSSDWYFENGITALSPEVYENLLYYLTEPTDIVFDPFGNITTIDVCKKRLRRFYVCDKNPAHKDIRKHYISDGLPEGLPMPNLVFLNPFSGVTPAQIGEIAKGLKDKLRNKFAYLVFVTPKIGKLSEGNDLSLLYAMAISRHFEYQYKIFLSSLNQDEWDIDKAKSSKDILGAHREILIFTNGVISESKTDEVKEPEPEVKQEVVAPAEEVTTPYGATVTEKTDVSSKPEAKKLEIRQPTAAEMLENSRKAKESKSNGASGAKSKNIKLK
jgi:hypothetical protein